MNGSIPQRCWPGCEFILWRAAWEHSPCSVVWAEWSSLLPAHPEPALLRIQLSPSSKGTPQTKLHTHTQGCSGDQYTGANLASKPNPEQNTPQKSDWFILYSSVQAHVENLIKNSLKCQQRTHNSTFLPSFDSSVPPHSYLNASTWRSDGDSRLKQHKKSQVLFNRALWGRQTHTLICWLIFQWCSLADRSAAWISFQLGIEHKTEHKNSLFFPSCPHIVINVLL